MIALAVSFAVMGTTSIACACVIAYAGNRDRAHQAMMEGVGCWAVSALFTIALRLPA